MTWHGILQSLSKELADSIGLKAKPFANAKPAMTAKAHRSTVGVPFLAGTYDERMFEELRMRAQTFEVLTGGDHTNGGGKSKVDDASGADVWIDRSHAVE
jgi:hypothetical protein